MCLAITTFFSFLFWGQPRTSKKLNYLTFSFNSPSTKTGRVDGKKTLEKELYNTIIIETEAARRGKGAPPEPGSRFCKN